MERIQTEIYTRLANTPQEWQTLEDQIGAVFDVHRGIATTATEDTTMRRILNPVVPVKRELIDRPDEDGKATGPRRGDYVYDVPIEKELDAMIAADPDVIKQLRAASDSWAKERPQKGASRVVYADISDGAVLRQHPENWVSTQIVVMAQFAWHSYYTTTTWRS